MRRIGYVILTWNSGRYIENCVRAIGGVDPGAFENTAVIVDNGSTDDTLARIEAAWRPHAESAHRLDVIRLDANEGTTVSRNRGLKRLFSIAPDVDYVCVLDSDTEINEAALAAMARALDDARVGIVGPRLHNAEGAYQISGRDFSTATEKLLKVMPVKRLRALGERMGSMIPVQGSGCRAVGFLVSACWMMRRETCQELGGLDERIFYAPEDLEYCIRCWQRGYRVAYCYDADILHLWQRLSRKKLISRHNWEQIRGLIHVFAKYRYALGTKRLWASFPK